MGLDTLIALMIDGPDGKIALQFLERLFHFGELDVEAPQFRRRLAVRFERSRYRPSWRRQARKRLRFSVKVKVPSDGLSCLGQRDRASLPARPASFCAAPIFRSSWSRDGACLSSR